MATYKFTLVSPGFATIQKDNGRTTPFSGSFESTGLADDDGAFFIFNITSHSYSGNFKLAGNTFLINGAAPTVNTADGILNQISKDVFPKATGNAGTGVAVNPLTVPVGDSITANQITTYALASGTAQNAINSNFINVAQVICAGKFYVPIGGNKGVNGNATSDVIARMDAIIALKPKMSTVLIGTNDITASTPAATIITNITTIYDALKAIGCVVIPICITPRFAGSGFELNAGQEAIRQTVNAFIRTQANFVETESMNSSTYYFDGLHPNIVGSYLLGNLVAQIINKMITGKPSDSLFTNSLNQNPLMIGTSGSKTTATGTVANNYDLQGNEAGGASVVGSKGSDNKQIIAISGNYTGNGMKSQLQYYFNAAGLFSNNDLVEAFIEIEIMTAMVSIATIDAVFTLQDPSFATTYVNSQAFYSGDATVSCQLPIGKYVLRTPPSLINSSSAAQMVFRLAFVFKNAATSTAVSGQFKVHRMGVRKVV